MMYSRVPDTCPICGKSMYFMDVRELKSIYDSHDLKYICEDCGEKASRSVRYYGKKKKEDVDQVLTFINSGIEPQRRLSAMMNGGYYDVQPNT